MCDLSVLTVFTGFAKVATSTRIFHFLKMLRLTTFGRQRFHQVRFYSKVYQDAETAVKDLPSDSKLYVSLSL